MIRKAPDSGWRATFLAAALFAITLNFLQPVAHAVLLRHGASGALWTVFCHAAAADHNHAADPGRTHGAAGHECCLGLAHAQALIDPSPSFLPVAFTESVMPALPAAKNLTPVGARDGPHKPRAPPSFLV